MSRDGKYSRRVLTFKRLRVQITWDTHVQCMLTKTHPRVNYPSVARRALPSDVLTQIYLTFISPVWGRLYKGLEQAQKRYCRIFGISPLPVLTLKDTFHALQNILRNSSSRLHAFMTQASSSGYQIRRQRLFAAKKNSTKNMKWLVSGEVQDSFVIDPDYVFC